MKDGSGVVKAHFIPMVTSLTCSSVVLVLRVSDGLNGCECKHKCGESGVAGAKLEGCCTKDRYDRLCWVKLYNLRRTCKGFIVYSGNRKVDPS